ncbi:hypothetical protein KGF56_004480 [Candida oxycetoniae]|uniref:Peptidase S8/S53 domain-containing protein n=1 Tax=Candida oxycetoniae TaxID=497107 RepID=A0AAI9STK5_9ASCO|nr:uncharacterized protein KGF56_004480 [Candida oxycetoniae]KAI3402806.2 hypothetical protein KGF56_004480 [Candida oxycetoniae]
MKYSICIYFLVVFTKLSLSQLAKSYVITLQPDVTLAAFLEYEVKKLEEFQIKEAIVQTFQIGDLCGFSGTFSDEAVGALAACPLVDEISQDVVVRSFDVKNQAGAPRHLARLSRRKRMNPNRKYPFIYDDDNVGKHVYAYVIDSGVNIGHPEFQGRARTGKDFTGEGPGDKNGHGTHIAGIIGSETYGVAKKVQVIDIKVLDSGGFGTLSSVISAIEFAVVHRSKSGRNGVANLSFGTTARNSVLESVIKHASQTGLLFVVAAGNSNIDACKTTPSSSPYTITVGAIDDHDDAIASFSNWGSCVDIFASGAYVRSVDIGNTYRASIMSGTSMASSVVAGLVANMLTEGIEPENIKFEVVNVATRDRIPETSFAFRPGTVNRIANNGFDISQYKEG